MPEYFLEVCLLEGKYLGAAIHVKHEKISDLHMVKGGQPLHFGTDRSQLCANLHLLRINVAEHAVGVGIQGCDDGILGFFGHGRYILSV